MAVVVPEIKLYELLRAKIGEREAEAFIHILETKVENKFQEKTSVFATKEDLARVEGSLLTTISETKVDIIKWVIGTNIALFALFLTCLKFFFH